MLQAIMGISAEQHRACVGLYHSVVHRVCSGYNVNRGKCEKSNKNRFDFQCAGCVGFVIYFYVLLYLFSMTLDIASHDSASDSLMNKYSHPAATQPLYSSDRIYYNLYFLIIVLTSYRSLANKMSKKDASKINLELVFLVSLYYYTVFYCYNHYF